MRQYDYVFCPDPNAQGEWTVEGMDLEHECVAHIRGPIIVLTPDELLDLMQQSAERGITTLTRQRAEELLSATLKYNQ